VTSRNHVTSSGLWDEFERVVVIIGCQRSGTTLTGQIVGAHPQAFLVDEPDGLYPWFHAEVDRREEARALAVAMLQCARRKYQEEDRRRHLGDFRGGRGADATVLVLKAPNLTYDADRIASLPVPISVVYPVRDPRAVVASMAQLDRIDFVRNQLRLLDQRPGVVRHFAAEYQIIANEEEPRWIRQAAVWKIKTNMAEFFQQAGLPTTQFKYEDLVRDPERVISAILEGCHLSQSTETLRPHEFYIGHGPGGTDRARSIDAGSLFNWERLLDEVQQADIIRIAGALGRKFGYG
jgi:hypothetical protein